MRRDFIFAFVLTVGILLTTGCGTTSFKNARDIAREKACAANMRVIGCAIELYNMDNKVFITELKPEMIETNGSLLQQKCLRHPIRKPEHKCSYCSRGNLGDPKDEKAEIFCTFHGSVQEIDNKLRKK